VDTGSSVGKDAYAPQKRAIAAMDIYDHAQEIRLCGRGLLERLRLNRRP
jgi:hypothetical protein